MNKEANAPIPIAEGHIAVSCTFEYPEVSLQISCPVCHSTDAMDMETLQKTRLISDSVLDSLNSCESAGHVYAVKVMEK